MLIRKTPKSCRDAKWESRAPTLVGVSVIIPLVATRRNVPCTPVHVVAISVEPAGLENVDEVSSHDSFSCQARTCAFSNDQGFFHDVHVMVRVR